MLTETLTTTNVFGLSDTQIYAALLRQAELYCQYTLVGFVAISAITFILLFSTKTKNSAITILQLYVIYAFFWLIFILPDVITAQYNPTYFAFQQLLQK